MKLISLISLVLLFSSCQINDEEKEKAIEHLSNLTVDHIQLMMLQIYAKGLEGNQKESLLLGKKVNTLLREKQDSRKCISLIKESLNAGLCKKELKLILEEENLLNKRILDAENIASKFDQIKEVHTLMIKILHIRGLRLDYPRIVLKQADTLELQPNRKYKFPIEIIHKNVGGLVYKNYGNTKEIEINTKEYTDLIKEEFIELEVQNQITDERYSIKEKVYIKMKRND